MKTLTQFTTGMAAFALAALLFLPLAGAAGGDGTGPAPGTGRQLNQQENWNGPCYGPGQGRGPCGGHYRNCYGPGQGRGPKGYGPGQGRGFVDKDGDGICDYHPNNGKGGGDATTK